MRHDGRNSTGDTVRDRISPFTGERSHTVQRSRQEGLNDSAGINGAVTYANTYHVRPAGRLDARARQANLNDKRVADFTADYERPVGQSMVKAGFKAVSTHNDIDARYFDINPQSQVETVSSTRTNRFQLDETIVALYGTC